VEAGFDKPNAPIRRVVRLDVPVPYSLPLEEAISSSEQRVVEAIRATLH
jgi:pyruvate/2-oxoglutarate/acetoin dehydrogenase E1 component